MIDVPSLALGLALGVPAWAALEAWVIPRIAHRLRLRSIRMRVPHVRDR